MTNDLLFRSASIKPNSFNKESRTFTAVLATATPIARRGGFEVLDLGTMQLPASAPILLDHRATVDATVGKAENLRREGDTIVADCRISGDPALASLCERLADGIVDGVSIGYSVPKWTESKSASGERVRTAVNATLRHAALVAEPADSAAGIRSPDDEARRGQPQRAKLGRCAARLGVSRDLEDRAVDEQWGDEDIRAAVHNRSRADIRTTSQQTFDDPAFHRTAMIDALVARMGGSEPQGAARELAGLSWPELHRRHLRQAGQSITGLSDVEVITRALTTSRHADHCRRRHQRRDPPHL